uniref:Uncharacterized protein n=1 Tax=Ixodes ricinus TaxID=34613 RepID=A0A6B0UJX4_IXORI
MGVNSVPLLLCLMSPILQSSFRLFDCLPKGVLLVLWLVVEKPSAAARREIPPCSWFASSVGEEADGMPIARSAATRSHSAVVADGGGGRETIPVFTSRTVVKQVPLLAERN